MSLPTDRNARNALPVWDGCLVYFPDVWAEIAKVSALGNQQHGLGDKLHWDTTVSTDHQNKVIRHMLDDATGQVMDDGGQTFHLAKAAWRILAALQLRVWERDGKDAHGKPIVRQGFAVTPGGALMHGQNFPNLLPQTPGQLQPVAIREWRGV